MPENKEIINDNNIEQKIETNKLDIGTEIVDLEKNREVTVPREVKSWMEKIESDPQQQNNNQNSNSSDDSALQPINSVKQVVLPTTKNNFSTGFSKTLFDAGRWLSEFVLRIIKKNKGNVKFKEE
ncbi:MAG: hypothetical protein PHX34_03860 [Candidatus Shapirobacteria bacterium]|nr:hypothetical protein [Candidatus Shapirobacteria bacterium]